MPRQIAVGHDRRVADRLLHHLVQHLLDRELARGVQVRAGAARLGDDRPLFVGEQAHRLGAARIDAEHVHVS